MNLKSHSHEKCVVQWEVDRYPLWSIHWLIKYDFNSLKSRSKIFQSFMSMEPGEGLHKCSLLKYTRPIYIPET